MKATALRNFKHNGIAYKIGDAVLLPEEELTKLQNVKSSIKLVEVEIAAIATETDESANDTPEDDTAEAKPAPKTRKKTE